MCLSLVAGKFERAQRGYDKTRLERTSYLSTHFIDWDGNKSETLVSSRTLGRLTYNKSSPFHGQPMEGHKLEDPTLAPYFPENEKIRYYRAWNQWVKDREKETTEESSKRARAAAKKAAAKKKKRRHTKGQSQENGSSSTWR